MDELARETLKDVEAQQAGRDIVVLLVKAGAELEAKGRGTEEQQGMTAIQEALLAGNVGIAVKLLGEWGRGRERRCLAREGGGGVGGRWRGSQERGMWGLQ